MPIMVYWLFWVGNQLYKSSDAITYLKELNVDSPEQVNILLNQLNGQWACIIQKDNVIFAAVDHIRTIPIFYTI